MEKSHWSPDQSPASAVRMLPSLSSSGSRRHTLDHMPSSDELRHMYGSTGSSAAKASDAPSAVEADASEGETDSLAPLRPMPRRRASGGSLHSRSASDLSNQPRSAPPMASADSGNVPRLTRSKTNESLQSISSVDEGWATPRTSVPSPSASRFYTNGTTGSSSSGRQTPTLRSQAGRDFVRERESLGIRRSGSSSSSGGEAAMAFPPPPERPISPFGSLRQHGEVDYLDRRGTAYRRGDAYSRVDKRQRCVVASVRLTERAARPGSTTRRRSDRAAPSRLASCRRPRR